MSSKSDTELPKTINVINTQNCVQYDSIRSLSYVLYINETILYVPVAVDDNAPALVGEFL